MIDLSLTFNAERFDFDLTLIGEPPDMDLQGDDGLLTAIIVSLFTDRRANADDPLPDERVGVPSDVRGWWGDHILEEDARDPLGSRLWLLSREKDMDVVVARAQQYTAEAVAWLIRGGHVADLRVRAFRAAPGYLGIEVLALPAPGGDDQTREWNFVYDYVNAAPVSIRLPGTL
jgi:phage gp46-like protein